MASLLGKSTQLPLPARAPSSSQRVASLRPCSLRPARSNRVQQLQQLSRPSLRLVPVRAQQANEQQQQQENDQVEWDQTREYEAQQDELHLPPGKVIDVMAKDLDAVLQKAGSKLVMVDVYTQWCGPCKMIAPEIEVMAEELGDSVILSKMDCTSDNDNKKWAMAQKVRALPTFIFFKNGERITEMTGAKTSSLRKLIDAHK